MVFLTISLLSKKLTKRSKRSILDSLRIYAKGGSGGFGLKKYGGVGGSGGDVVIQGSPDTTFKKIIQKNTSKRFIAGNGENSSSKRILGLKGSDLNINVPLGVTAFNEAGVKIGEINKEGEQVRIAQGGIGGCPDTNFDAKASQGGIVILDLKLIADVGLVGFPNAGKSTLLSCISNAKPKIASYPFTTIEPNLGVINYPDLRQITIADLPGLIEGAHVNIGMGFRFLKHVERTKVLLVVVDVSGFKLSPRHRSRTCLENIIILNKELELYREELLLKPAVLVVNKMDLPDAHETFKSVEKSMNNFEAALLALPEELRPKVPFAIKDIIPMKAIEKNENEITQLKNSLRQVIDEFENQIDVEDECKLAESIDRRFKLIGPKLI